MFHEREMYDMMGIVFDGNRDLRRIYMSPDYRSFPQRKDFILPDDAADSPAAGVVPLERPETWDSAASASRPPAPRRRTARPGPAETNGTPSEPSRPPRSQRPASPTRSISTGRRRRAWPPRWAPAPRARALRRPAARAAEYAGFEMVGIPDRPPQTERERRCTRWARARCSSTWGRSTLHPRRHAAGGEGPRRDGDRPRRGAGLPAPRHREAVRERDVHHGPDLRRPHGLHVGHAQRARAGDRLREAVRHQGAAARRVHPGRWWSS